MTGRLSRIVAVVPKRMKRQTPFPSLGTAGYISRNIRRKMRLMKVQRVDSVRASATSSETTTNRDGWPR